MQTIIIRTQFEGIHQWSSAPEEVGFLRSCHRHIFYVEVEMSVEHSDREVEIISLKRRLSEDMLQWMPQHITDSCEKMAQQICDYLRTEYGDERYITVSVLEDNENGGKVYYGR